jgi:hypothetical protein
VLGRRHGRREIQQVGSGRGLGGDSPQPTALDFHLGAGDRLVAGVAIDIHHEVLVLEHGDHLEFPGGGHRARRHALGDGRRRRAMVLVAVGAGCRRGGKRGGE